MVKTPSLWPHSAKRYTDVVTFSRTVELLKLGASKESYDGQEGKEARAAGSRAAGVHG